MEFLVEKSSSDAVKALVKYANSGANIETLLASAYEMGRIEGKQLMLRDCLDTLNNIST